MLIYQKVFLFFFQGQEEHVSSGLALGTTYMYLAEWPFLAVCLLAFSLLSKVISFFTPEAESSILFCSQSHSTLC